MGGDHAAVLFPPAEPGYAIPQALRIEPRMVGLAVPKSSALMRLLMEEPLTVLCGLSLRRCGGESSSTPRGHPFTDYRDSDCRTRDFQRAFSDIYVEASPL